MIRGGISRTRSAPEGATLFTADVGRAVRFYIETLGMKLVSERADGSATIDAGDGFLLALDPRGARSTDEASVTLFAKVPLDEAIAIYENRGVAFDIDRSGPVLARFRDPDDNLLCLSAPV